MWADVETKQDFLNYTELAEVVAGLLSDPTMLPLSVGISGGWGTGKSSMLNLIEAKLPEDTPERRFLVVRFDAWLYQGYDDARAALLDAVAKRLLAEAEAKDHTLVGKASSLFRRANKLRVLGLVGEGAAAAAGYPAFGFITKGVNALDRMLQGPTDETDVTDLKEAAETAKKKAEGLLRPEEKATPPQEIEAFRREFGEMLEGLKAVLVVFVDNLDRCLPQQTIHTLEALRLVLFMNNTAFCVAADEDMVRRSVAKHFDDISEQHIRDYLDKLIQIPIRVPRLGVQEIRSYLFLLFASATAGISNEQVADLRMRLEENLREAWTNEPISVREAVTMVSDSPPKGLAEAFDMADRMAPLLANSSAVSGNPRIIKRLLNTVRIRTRIAGLRKLPLEETIVAKLALFERCMGEGASVALYSDIQSAGDGRSRLLTLLQETEEDEAFSKQIPKEWASPEQVRFLREWLQLEPKLAGVDLRPALHLSRDTLALIGRRRGLSETATKALEILAAATATNSPAAMRAAERIPTAERRDVMDALVSGMRGHTQWRDESPPGWAGAQVLARTDTGADQVLQAFVNSATEGTVPPWLKVAMPRKGTPSASARG